MTTRAPSVYLGIFESFQRERERERGGRGREREKGRERERGGKGGREGGKKTFDCETNC